MLYLPSSSSSWLPCSAKAEPALSTTSPPPSPCPRFRFNFSLFDNFVQPLRHPHQASYTKERPREWQTTRRRISPLPRLPLWHREEAAR